MADKTTIMLFMGTRPEAIKLAPVVRALLESGDFEPIVVSTGQHREMLDQVVQLFGIPVHHELNVMVPNQTLAGLTSRLIAGIDDLLAARSPKMVVVQGDTTTVLAAGLASFYRDIPIAHVEAGLRTGNMRSPFPEELNRVAVSKMARLHFAPTTTSAAALLGEGVSASTVTVTGNTVIDALRLEVERQRTSSSRLAEEASIAELLGFPYKERRFVLITGHRRESFGGGFEQICEAIADLADRFPGVEYVYPVHLNPNVQAPVRRLLSNRANVRLVAPQAYDRFVALMAASTVVLTDSGGVQEEAPGLGRPVIVMRDTTERPEGVAAGTVKLVGADRARIVEAVSTLLTDDEAYSAMSQAINPYGDGYASGRILASLRTFFGHERTEGNP